MNIEVFHDLICPWCRIGIQNLEEALKSWDGPETTIQYRTFLLNPGAPEDGITFNDYMKKKGAENTKFDDFVEPIINAGKKIDLNFNFNELSKISNTIVGHRLVHLTPEKNKSDIIYLLHKACFEEGQDISDINILLELAKNLNLDVESIKAELMAEGGKQETLMDFYYAMNIRITAVPMFIFDIKAVLFGAQTPEKIIETMKEAELLPDPVEEEIDEVN